MSTHSELISLTLQLDPLTANTCWHSVPRDGVLKWSRVSFPQSQNLVQARLFIGGTQMVPAKGDVLIDNGTVDIPLGYAVHEGDIITMWAGNQDKANPHNITSSLLLESQDQGYAPQSFYPAGAIIEPEPDEAPQPSNPPTIPPPTPPPSTNQPNQPGAQSSDGGSPGAPNFGFPSIPTSTNIGIPPRLIPRAPVRTGPPVGTEGYGSAAGYSYPTPSSDNAPTTTSTGLSGSDLAFWILLAVIVSALIVILTVVITQNGRKSVS